MIPKVIHYCWFGRNEKSSSILKCIDSWKKYCPDYKIIEWNEDNFDIDCIPFVRGAYDAKKWAFVTDYARLKIIYENGGIYLDTDVELIRSLDALLPLSAYAGFQDDDLVNTGLGFGAEKGNRLVLAMMEDYHNRTVPEDPSGYALIACPIINTRILEGYGFSPNGVLQKTEDMTVFPADYFCPKDSQTYKTRITDNTYSIHHFDATWKNKNASLKQKIIRAVVFVIGKERFMKLKEKLKKNSKEE